MKKIVCFLFLIILLSVGVVFQSEKVNVFECVKFNKIKVISLNRYSEEYVNNGNLFISNCDMLDNIDLEHVEGITFQIDGDFNIYNFTNRIGLHNFKKYMVDDICIIEGKLSYRNNLNFDRVQIAINNDIIKIGFPIILDSF